VRQPILVVALAFIGLFMVLTFDVAVREGPDVLTIVSLLVLAMFAFGVIGALRHPPDE
jgi:hypothetical protein